MRNARYPSVLVECGYLSNRSEARDAASADYREQLADKIAEAIVDYRFGADAYRRKPTVVARAGGGSSIAAPLAVRQIAQRTYCTDLASRSRISFRPRTRSRAASRPSAARRMRTTKTTSVTQAIVRA